MPTKAKAQPAGETVPALTPEEAEAQAQETPQADSEVRPEELTQGTGPSAAASPLQEEVIAELRKPLAPNRVRRRGGRGGGKFEYLAGHDVKRRANELFGFGNWGYRVLSITEQEMVPVQSESGKEGWHVAYMAEVEVTVRGCLPFSDVGYGDGVEYGPAAKATARELALKESATDALKRAFTGWGDQFGLILYAKADEKKRIDSERNADEAQPVYRQQEAGSDAPPRSWPEIAARMKAVLGNDAEEARYWTEEALSAQYGKTYADMDSGERKVAGQKLAGVVVDLEELSAEVGDLGFSKEKREQVSRIFAKRFEGIKLVGPPWKIAPDESFPTKEEHLTKPGPADESGSPDDADDIEFAPKGEDVSVKSEAKT